MAGVDQGAAGVFTQLEVAGFVLPRLVGPGFGSAVNAGVGQPVGNATYNAHVFDLGALVGARTNVDRPAIAASAVVNHGAAYAEPDDVTPMDELWWEAIHILPRAEVAFGNILTQEQDEYEIYNAFRGQSVTLTGITNNATPGINLPNVTPPEVLLRQTSLLHPDTTDNCSDTIALGTIELLDVIATQDGLPIFDMLIDFAFSPGNQVQLFVSGQRIVLFPFEYESPAKEVLSFLTDVIPALSGKEQRISLRKQPRQLFEVVYKMTGNDRRRFQSLLMGFQGNVFGFPVQHERLELTAATLVGATQYQVLGASEVDLRVGGLAVVFTDANTFDVLNLTAVTDTLLTAADPALNAYPAGTVVYPVRTARILRAVEGARASVELETFKITFEVTDNDTGALTGDTSGFSTHNSRVLLDDCNVVSGAEMQEQFTQRIHRIDNQTGIVSVVSPWDRNKRSHQKGFGMHSRAEILSFRRLQLALRGRQKAFYIPTFIEDLEVKATLSSGSNTMDIERIDYERFIQSREPKKTFRITFTDGTSLIRVVQSATGVDASTERLTLDTTWPANRTVDEVQRVEFYELVRNDSDDVVIRYPGIGQAACQMPVKQVFDDN